MSKRPIAKPCTKCRLPIIWRRQSGSGKWQCFNADNTTSHWDACSQERTRIVKRDGVPFSDAQGRGYIHDGKKKYHEMVAVTDHGKPVQP